MNHLAEPKAPLDAVNQRLLEVLGEDSRLSVAELARRVQMSAPAVRERIARLEEAGVIRGYRLDVDPAALGLPVTAWVRLRPGPVSWPRSLSWPSGRRRSVNVTASPVRTASCSRSTCRASRHSSRSSTGSWCTARRRAPSSSPPRYHPGCREPDDGLTGSAMAPAKTDPRRSAPGECRRDHHQVGADRPAHDAEHLPAVARCSPVRRNSSDDGHQANCPENVCHRAHCSLPSPAAMLTVR